MNYNKIGGILGGSAVALLALAGSWKLGTQTKTQATAEAVEEEAPRRTKTTSSAPRAKEPPASVLNTPEPDPTNPMTYDDAATAFKVSKPGDSIDTLDDGTAKFAVWSSQRLKWSDVYAEKNDTTPNLILKDPEAERGKRVCWSGVVVQIETSRGTGTPIYTGVYTTELGSVVSFVAVKSSGDIVKGSPARFCGLVTGRHSYKNVTGGQTHAVQLVGMFDLPENRR